MKNGILVLLAIIIASCQPSDDTKPQGATPPAKIASTPEFTYPNCEELNTLWKTRYHAQLKITWPLQDIACTGPSKDRAFAEAAYILEKTVFNLEKLPDGVNAPPEDMLGFITEKYKEIRMYQESYPSTDVVNKILYFYPAIENEGGFAVIGNLIHEARHADSLAYLHVKCWDGPNKDVEMCDNGIGDSFYVGGSHRVALLYYAWATARSNWPAEWKAVIKGLTEKIATQRINASQEDISAWLKRYFVDLAVTSDK